ncbi:MAG: hypothetical protein PVJ71_04715, partial [Lysobacterales bacterium]
MALGYIVSCWLLAQVADLVLEAIGAPDWVMQTILLVLALGFPVVVFFSWAYEVTPDGIKHQAEVDRTQSITHVTGRKLDRAILGVLVVALGYFIWEARFSSDAPAEPSQGTPQDESLQTVAGDQPTGTPDDRKSVAVLPFVDMSPEKDQEYFTDGLTENLLNALAQLRELKVAGRTSSFAFKGLNEDLRKIGEQLGVAHVLEGSVQKSGERVRITAQLINAGDGYHLWSETYDRTLQDIFAVQDEIASEVARAMKVTLLGHAEHAQPEISQTTGDAYNTYLKGLYESRRGNLEGHNQAIAYFQQAVQQDPGLALAWAGLAASRAYVTGFQDTDFKAGFEQARAAALR